ncbi:MAG: pyroglutamyl-peptidase I [Clostridia bacterium]|nr:pyroglutamyl-peptidase I [Clostridia bacterium]
MRKLLITGFEAFGGETINPSWDAVCRLPDVIIDFSITKLCLPVVFGEAPQKAIDAAKILAPDVILCIGQAGGRAAVTPEMVGINLRHASIPDNNSNQPSDDEIIKGGDKAYFSTLPVRKIAENIKSKGIAAQVSYSAGTYVCNDLLYSLLAHFNGTKTRVGFIHVPYSDEQQKGNMPSMPLDTIVSALIAAIEAI